MRRTDPKARTARISMTTSCGLCGLPPRRIEPGIFNPRCAVDGQRRERFSPCAGRTSAQMVRVHTNRESEKGTAGRLAAAGRNRHYPGATALVGNAHVFCRDWRATPSWHQRKAQLRSRRGSLRTGQSMTCRTARLHVSRRRQARILRSGAKCHAIQGVEASTTATATAKRRPMRSSWRADRQHLEADRQGHGLGVDHYLC
jgi:hypothetical protein